jgi:hypothetical protein
MHVEDKEGVRLSNEQGNVHCGSPKTSPWDKSWPPDVLVGRLD